MDMYWQLLFEDMQESVRCVFFHHPFGLNWYPYRIAVEG